MKSLQTIIILFFLDSRVAEEFEEALPKKRKKKQSDINRLPKYIYYIPERKGLKTASIESSPKLQTSINRTEK